MMVYKPPMLIATAIVLEIALRELALLGVRGFALGTAVFLINLVLCARGFATGQYRIFWCIWGVASVVTFLFFGMATPFAMVLVLPTTLWLVL